MLDVDESLEDTIVSGWISAEVREILHTL
jgi:hypothetical protein